MASFSMTSGVSRHQKGKTILSFNVKARDDGVLRWQWHQQGHMQTICISLQADNQATLSLIFMGQGRVLFLSSNQQCQSTENNSQCINFEKKFHTACSKKVFSNSNNLQSFLLY